LRADHTRPSLAAARYQRTSPRVRALRGGRTQRPLPRRVPWLTPLCPRVFACAEGIHEASSPTRFQFCPPLVVTRAPLTARTLAVRATGPGAPFLFDSRRSPQYVSAASNSTPTAPPWCYSQPIH
jgi:hypothetical protein